MKSLYGRFLALAMLMGGMNPMGGAVSTPKRKPETREMTEEELKKRLEKFTLDLKTVNDERLRNCPKFKQFEVHGFIIIAFNQKNATRDIDNLLKRNLIEIEVK